MASLLPTPQEVERLSLLQVNEHLRHKSLSTKGSRFVKLVRLFNCLYGQQHDVFPTANGNGERETAGASSGAQALVDVAQPAAPADVLACGPDAAVTQRPQDITDDALDAVVGSMSNARKDEVVIAHMKMRDPQGYSTMLRQAVCQMKAAERTSDTADADVYYPRKTTRECKVWSHPKGFYLLRSAKGTAFCKLCCPLRADGKHPISRDEWDMRGVKSYKDGSTHNLATHSRSHGVVFGSSDSVQTPKYPSPVREQVQELLVKAFVIFSLLPLRFFENEWIQAAFEIINPRVALPTHQVVQKIITDLSATCRRRISDHLTPLRGKTRCILEFDCWPAPTREDYIGIFVQQGPP
jgi:hypothetical protein